MSTKTVTSQIEKLESQRTGHLSNAASCKASDPIERALGNASMKRAVEIEAEIDALLAAQQAAQQAEVESIDMEEMAEFVHERVEEAKTRAPMDTRTAYYQLTTGALMRCGAHKFYHGEDYLAFMVNLHPVLKSGKRGEKARLMTATLTLGWNDLYNLKVTYWDGRKHETVNHYEGSDLYADSLATVLIMLDSGDLPAKG